MVQTWRPRRRSAARLRGVGPRRSSAPLYQREAVTGSCNTPEAASTSGRARLTVRRCPGPGGLVYWQSLSLPRRGAAGEGSTWQHLTGRARMRSAHSPSAAEEPLVPQRALLDLGAEGGEECIAQRPGPPARLRHGDGEAGAADATAVIAHDH